jgi:hypothetical protein
MGAPRSTLLLLVDFFFFFFGRALLPTTSRTSGAISNAGVAFKTSSLGPCYPCSNAHSTSNQVRLYGKGHVEPIHRNSISIPNKLVLAVLPGCRDACIFAKGEGGQLVAGDPSPTRTFFPTFLPALCTKEHQGPLLPGTSILDAVAAAQHSNTARTGLQSLYRVSICYTY